MIISDFLSLTFDLADRGRDEHHARVAVETLVMRKAELLLFLQLLAVLVLLDERRLLAKLHPGALCSARCRVCGGGRRGGRRRGLGRSFCFSCGRCRSRLDLFGRNFDFFFRRVLR